MAVREKQSRPWWAWLLRAVGVAVASVRIPLAAFLFLASILGLGLLLLGILGRFLGSSER